MSATCELLHGRDFNPYYGNVLELAIVNERAPSGLCLCPFYCGQVMDRYACSGSSCWNSFYDMFMTHLWKGENQKCVFENIPHLRIINLWDLVYWGSFDFYISFTIIENIIPQHDRTCYSKITIFEYYGCANFLTCTATPVIMRQKGTWSHLSPTWSNMFL